jgi:hypothetical protein
MPHAVDKEQGSFVRLILWRAGDGFEIHGGLLIKRISTSLPYKCHCEAVCAEAISYFRDISYLLKK